jgi:hypothetical protein
MSLILLNNINLEYVIVESIDYKQNYSYYNNIGIIDGDNKKDSIRFFFENKLNRIEEFLSNENDMKNKLIDLLNNLNEEKMLFELPLNEADFEDTKKYNESISENKDIINNIKDKDKFEDNLFNEDIIFDCK